MMVRYRPSDDMPAAFAHQVEVIDRQTHMVAQHFGVWVLDDGQSLVVYADRNGNPGPEVATYCLDAVDYNWTDN